MPQLVPGSYSSPRWSYEVTDCAMPMTFDQYSRCGYNCFYCFSQYQKAVGCAKENYFSGDIRSVSVPRIRALFTGQNPKSQFHSYIQYRKVMQWGGMADPFCSNEKKFGVGLELLQLFKEINYPLCFSTKGAWWAQDARYTDLFHNQKNWNTKFSIVTLDENMAKLCETGAPPVAERFKAMERVAALNAGGVTLRLRPFIIGISDKTCEALIKRAASCGATAMSTEFFCLEGRSLTLAKSLGRISRAVGFDLFRFYKKYSYGQGYLRLSREVKRRYVDLMEDTCRRYKMRFYVSDAHFKERCTNGCCCGLDPSWNYSRGQFCEALQIAKKKGFVHWKDVSVHLAYAKGFLYRKADGLNTSSAENRAKFYTFTLFDWLHYIWNHPNIGNSPYKMYEGILVPKNTDIHRDLVYHYDRSKA